LAEAKAGAGLGKLVVDASGYRQGSLRFFESRLARAVGEGVPEATELRTALANSRVDLFGGFKASNKLYQFDPNVFIDYVNFKLVPGAAILVP